MLRVGTCFTVQSKCVFYLTYKNVRVELGLGLVCTLEFDP